MNSAENVAALPLQRCIKVYNNYYLLNSIYHNLVIYIRYTCSLTGRIVLIATLQRQRLQRIAYKHTTVTGARC
jgi:hypothetical protein